MFGLQEELSGELEAIARAGAYKREAVVASAQGGRVEVGCEPILNFCSNNYLGLSNHPTIVAAAKKALDRWGFGMASVRSICGTQSLHIELEAALAGFLGTEAAILYSSCFDANGGVFEVLLDERDAVISDELNHASIIDGIRLCKAARHRYRNRDMEELEARLEAAAGARRRLIVTDGVFSMDGSVAPLSAICALAERFGAMVMVDDSHAAGFIGSTGAGTPEAAGVRDRVDIVSGTLGKALGGASGGYIGGRSEIVALLRQRSRPYVFSNSLPPPIVAASLAALGLVASSSEERRRLHANAARFRERMAAEGFDLLPGEHPIVPVMFGEATIANRIAAGVLDRGVLVTSFSYPIVPKGQARVRVQLSAVHTTADVESCVAAFVDARRAVLADGEA